MAYRTREPTKYGNRKVFYNGICFDSKREMMRYQELRMLEKAGEIRDLQLQVRYGLSPSQYVNGKLKERAINYVADFTYRDKDNNLVVEDVKSEATKTELYVAKRKMMLYFHGIIIHEV